MSAPGSGRLDYVKYDETAQGLQDAAKQQCGDIVKMIEAMGAGRAQSIALTKIEECYMWIGKAIRDHQVMRNGGAQLQEERKNG